MKWQEYCMTGKSGAARERDMWLAGAGVPRRGALSAPEGSVSGSIEVDRPVRPLPVA